MRIIWAGHGARDRRVDGAGAHTLVWPTNVLNAGSIAGAASKHNIQQFYCDGTNARAVAAMLTGQN